MTVFPGADWHPLPQNATQGKITPRAFLFHTAVDSPQTRTLYDWFASAGAKGAETHLYVPFDGKAQQYMDFNVRADGAFDANAFGIQCEFQDGGDPTNPMTPAQVATAIEILRFLHDTYGIPLTEIPTPYGSGVGWHALFQEWNHSAHDCPGAVRIAQIRNTILPALAAPATPTPEDDDMPPTLLHDQTTNKVFAVQGLTKVYVQSPHNFDAWKFFGAIDKTATDGKAILDLLSELPVPHS